VTQAVLDTPETEAEQAPMPEEDTATPAARITSIRKPPKTARKPLGITNETWRRLSAKRQTFVAEYVQDGNALRAYEAAGYATKYRGVEKKTLQRRAYSVLRGRFVRQALLEEREQRAELDRDKKERSLEHVLTELERVYALALKKEDLAVAARCIELIGKTRGFFKESVGIDMVARREYSEAEREECRRLAELRIEQALESGSGSGSGIGPGAVAGPVLLARACEGHAVIQGGVDLGSVGVVCGEAGPPKPPEGGGAFPESTPTLM